MVVAVLLDKFVASDAEEEDPDAKMVKMLAGILESHGYSPDNPGAANLSHPPSPQAESRPGLGGSPVGSAGVGTTDRIAELAKEQVSRPPRAYPGASRSPPPPPLHAAGRCDPRPTDRLANRHANRPRLPPLAMPAPMRLCRPHPRSTITRRSLASRTQAVMKGQLAEILALLKGQQQRDPLDA